MKTIKGIPEIKTLAPLKPPMNINPHAVDTWFEACEFFKDQPNSFRYSLLNKYVELCDARDQEAFSFNYTNPNPAIKNFLWRRRKMYVRYLERTGLLDNVKIRRAPVKEAYLTDYGFAIRVEGWASVPDPYWFRRIKATPGWRFSLQWDSEQRCVVRVDPGLTIYVRNPNIRSPLTWYVGFEIHCPLVPKLENYKGTTIIRELWDSIAQTVRTKGLPQRRL